MKNENVKLLWTGGWDSTFRLCELIVLLKKKVQPYYLIDTQRQSLREELKAQETIKSVLLSRFPWGKDLLLPTKFYSLADLKIDDEISETYSKVKDEIGFGTQYKWLAAFCKTHQIFDLELGFERDPNSKKNKYLRNGYICAKINEKGLNTFISNPEKKGTPVYELFKYYEWPIWRTTREEMRPIARNNNFYDILHMTWFCHTPINGKTCGLCAPCKDAVIYNSKYRLTRRAMLRYRLRFLSKREILAKNPQLKNLIKTLMKK